MDGSLAHIFRHPVKSLGMEALDEVDLAKGKPMPFDRRWAIAHGKAEDIRGWARARNFVNQAFVPRLAQIETKFSPRNHLLELSHPDLPDVALQPGSAEGDDILAEWITWLTEGSPREGPFLIYDLHDKGAYTDIEDAHISIASESSRRALSEHAGAELQHIRFRMNLWIDGFAPYAELDWVGQEIEIGEARLKIIDRDPRCSATTANPQTGKTDVEVPKLLHAEFGHTDFGVYAQVVKSGPVRLGDVVRLT
ncbi:MAG: MOSC domain-containing protein [Paracoccaceae bacterium]